MWDNQPVQSLILTDQSESQLLQALKLHSLWVKPICTQSLDEAVKYTQEHALDIIFIDLLWLEKQQNIPKISEALSKFPILLLADEIDERLAEIVLQVGAQDYVLKGKFDPELLICSVCYAKKKYRLQDPAKANLDRAFFNERILAQSPVLLKAVLDSIGEGIVVADENGKFVFWNAAAEKMAGQGPTHLHPDQWSQFYGVFLPDQKTPYPANDLPLIRAIHGESTDNTLLFIRNAHIPSGIWVNCCARPIKDDFGQMIGGVVVFRDITDQKKSEVQIIQKNRDLETLIHIISHDLREPMRTIDNFSYLLRKRYEDKLDEKGKLFLELMTDGTIRMNRLLDDILTLSRVQRMDEPSEAVEAQEMIDEVLRRLKVKMQNSNAQVNIVSPLPHLRVNRTWAVQALYNLLSNALKFTKPDQAPDIEIEGYYNPDEYQTGLVIRDRGIGFTPELADRIFQIFQRAVGREIEGTGAGLAIVKQVAQRHGGNAWARPREGGGSEFFITFGPY